MSSEQVEALSGARPRLKPYLFEVTFPLYAILPDLAGVLCMLYKGIRIPLHPQNLVCFRRAFFPLVIFFAWLLLDPVLRAAIPQVSRPPPRPCMALLLTISIQQFLLRVAGLALLCQKQSNPLRRFPRAQSCASRVEQRNQYIMLSCRK